MEQEREKAFFILKCVDLRLPVLRGQNWGKRVVGQEREKAFFILKCVDLRLPVLRGKTGGGLWGREGRRCFSSRNALSCGFWFCGVNCLWRKWYGRM